MSSSMLRSRSACVAYKIGWDLRQISDTASGRWTRNARYLYRGFSKSWIDPHLYNLMLLSREDEELTARQILYVMNEEKESRCGTLR